MKVLLVDDDVDSRTSVSRFLKVLGHHVDECGSAGEALIRLCDKCDFPVVLSDIKMPNMSGIDLLRAVSQLSLATNVVFFTGHGSMESAIEALRMGAYDYLLKPVNVDELAAVINRIEEQISPTKRGDSCLNAQPDEKMRKAKRTSWGNTNTINVFSNQMRRVVNAAIKYHTDRSIPVLIEGETGTGKELIARLIHDGGKPTNQPFIDINCAALQPSLFESELFGYKAGSFTGGMNKDQHGKFDAAQGGTIFLDEVGEIPLELQAKLLRVVQEREYYRVGGLSKVRTDARMVCATNVNLTEAVAEGKFRQDLYYRLRIGYIFIPPLRERKEEIMPLAMFFLNQFTRQRNKGFKRISEEASRAILGHQWFGNVRELRNTIEWAVFMHDGEELKPDHLENANFVTDIISGPVGALPEYLEKKGSLLDRHVDQIVLDALRKNNGNKTATAKYLGISRRSIYRLLEKAAK
ncbi:MAG: sigma-54 dependent transcriptional regulator [Sporomusaceae bacterium]|nr:sigma-54 dependent transcriptional regulator [Sporomusaceae bacterium]